MKEQVKVSLITWGLREKAPSLSNQLNVYTFYSECSVVWNVPFLIYVASVIFLFVPRAK